jgi:hypothetical protein
MGSKIFLSHDHQDDELAKVLASVLSRVTLRQLDVWFSSDESASGGMRPGKPWVEEIRKQLAVSKAIIVLLTPKSLHKPWLLFESGFGAAVPDCDVIPLCIGVSTGEVQFPLAMYQCYQLADYESLKTFTSKLLQRYQISFDEEMSKPVLKRAIADFTRLSQAGRGQSEAQVTLADLSLDIKQHIDKRMIELVERREPSVPALSTMLGGDKHLPDYDNGLSYTVPITISFPDFTSRQYLEIDGKTMVQDILDNTYFMLDRWVEPFKYLQTWIIREVKHNVNLVVREVGGLIPAKYIFTPGTEWEAVKLDEPYRADASDDTDRWYKIRW